MDGFIGDFADVIGVERACRAFGTPARLYRYRRRRQRRTIRSEADAGAMPVAAEPAAVAVSPSGAPMPSGDSQLPAAAVARALPAAHPAALSSDERHEALNLLCSDRFVDLSPKFDTLT